MRYTMLQLFLTPRALGIFEGLDPPITRQEYIRQVFGTETRFVHRKRAFHFKPFSSPDADHVVGVIAKESAVTIVGPPAVGFAPKEVEDWDTANIFIETSSDSQKIGMQPTLGQPLAILRSLVDHLNDANLMAQWLLVVNPITESGKFWSAVSKAKGHISEVDLTFATPNVWGGQSETEKALRRFKTENNAQEVEVKIRNADGNLNPDSQQVRDSIEYIEAGGGTAKLRDEASTVIYSSENEENAVTVPVDPDPPVQEANDGLLASMIRKLFRT